MPLLRVESIAAGGDGVGRLDGLAVFTPRTAPGELVDVAVKQRGRMARGRLLRVVEPSAARVVPRCRHYNGDRCGGCQLQHLAIEAQLEAKQRIVQDAFTRIARRPLPRPDIVPSPKAWEYRSRLTLAMRWTGNRWIMGLHSFDDVDRVFDLQECPITDAAVVAAWAEIRVASRNLPRVTELRGTVRRSGDDLAFVLEGGDAWPAAREFARETPKLAVIRWRPARGADRVVVDRRSSSTPEASFDQVNQPVAAAARRELVDLALSVAPERVIDAYAGLGLTAKLLAEQGISVTAIESDEAAASFAASHLPAESRVIAGRVEEEIEGALPADVVIMNPPRAGVDARVTAALEAQRTRRLLYMSCDAATLARDVSRLPAYRVESVRAYDMFPQTAHVEIVCALVPEGS